MAQPNTKPILQQAGAMGNSVFGEIEDVRHRYEGFTGDIIEVQGSDGRTMKIEIAPMNSGETFKNVLVSVWEKRQGTREG